MNSLLDAIVIGAGQAGLAAGYWLNKRGMSFKILEMSGDSAGSWPNYYESLKLFSPAKYSSLPGYRFPGGGNRYPSRDEVVQYLRSYAKKNNLPIVHYSRVVEVKKDVSGTFQVTTSNGERYSSRNIVCATGSFSRPYIPDIPGQDRYEGEVIHSSAYMSPEPYRNRSVIVVGRGNSAVQIATELADFTDTTLAVREPVEWMPQRILGLDIHFWLKVTGVDTFWRIGQSSAIHASAVIDSGGYKRRLDQEKPPQKQMFTAFYPEGVIWSDGSKEKIDSIIFATGFRSNLPFLHGMGALDENGNPIHQSGVSPTVKGLYYVGLTAQRSFASATLRGVGADAKYVVNRMR